MSRLTGGFERQRVRAFLRGVRQEGGSFTAELLQLPGGEGEQRTKDAQERGCRASSMRFACMEPGSHMDGPGSTPDRLLNMADLTRDHVSGHPALYHLDTTLAAWGTSAAALNPRPERRRPDRIRRLRPRPGVIKKDPTRKWPGSGWNG